MYKFFKQNNCPEANGKTGAVGGGFEMVGWSIGNTWISACAAYVDAYSLDIQQFFKQNLRAFVLHGMYLIRGLHPSVPTLHGHPDAHYVLLDTPEVALGFPLAPKIWTPLIHQFTPMDQRVLFFLSWCTAYFDHGDLSKSDLNEIQYIVPSIEYVPSIYTMNAEERDEILEVLPDYYFDRILLAHHQGLRRAIYKRVVYDRKYRETHFPSMIVTSATGEKTHSFEIVGRFGIEEDDKASEGTHVDHWKWILGANHMVRERPCSVVSYCGTHCLDIVTHSCIGTFRKML